MAGRKRPVCKYGASCYRKNEQHLLQYSHPQQLHSTDEKEVEVNRGKKEVISFIIMQVVEEEEEGCVGSCPSPPAKKSRSTETTVAAGDPVAGGKEATTEEEEEEGMRSVIKRKFLVEMPDDFYQFWKFCSSLNPAHPHCECYFTSLPPSLLSLSLPLFPPSPPSHLPFLAISSQ